jgi:hypothetical protein
MTGHLATGVVPDRYSTRELQAAAAALVAREFLTSFDQANGRTTDNATARSSLSASPSPCGLPGEVADSRWDRPASTGLLVRVTAANAGAGASTIALALAQVAHSDESKVRLIDSAAPAWSGLIGAATTEMGAEHGWRRGTRSDGILIHRLADPVHSPNLVPVPCECAPVGVTVLDLGWTPRELAAAGDCWLTQTAPDVDIVVARAGTRALDQAEHLLSACDLSSTLLVTVGAARHLGRTLDAVGPQVRHLHEIRRAISVPLMTGKTPARLDLESLPPPLIRSARRLMDHIDDITDHSSRTDARI